jgi:CheY-like chemotaxis protein
MDDMFSALLDISRLDASVLQARLSIFPVASVINKVQMEFSQQARFKGLELRVAPCPALILSDPELLENILRNLVSNAVRYTVAGKILIGCRRTSRGIRLGVYDTGIGIAAELQPSIFEEFFQVGNQERDRSLGLGLGLAIAQRQARLLQAPLTMRSEPGRGSVFEIDLIRSALPSEPPIALFEDRRHRKGLRGALIVLVDDEALIVDAARLLLQQWGCVVIAAASGSDALQMLATISRAPDAIICDHRLRNNENGVEVIASLRTEFNRDIPAVLITGDTSPGQFKAIKEAGLPVLHKPLQSRVLENMLLDLLQMDDTEESEVE